MKLDIKMLERTDYSVALRFQKLLLEKRQKNEINDTLILVEHNPVITIGKRGVQSNINCIKRLSL